MDSRLLDLLVCPICKGPLDYDRSGQELICPRDHMAYTIRDGIPVMLVEQARDLDITGETPPGGPASDLMRDPRA